MRGPTEEYTKTTRCSEHTAQRAATHIIIQAGQNKKKKPKQQTKTHKCIRTNTLPLNKTCHHQRQPTKEPRPPGPRPTSFYSRGPAAAAAAAPDDVPGAAGAASASAAAGSVRGSRKRASMRMEPTRLDRATVSVRSDRNRAAPACTTNTPHTHRAHGNTTHRAHGNTQHTRHMVTHPWE